MTHQQISRWRSWRWWLGGSSVLLVLTTLMQAWQTIPPGSVGIAFNKASHTITPDALQPGWHLINPFTTGMQQYPIAIRTVIMTQASAEGAVAGDDALQIQSVDGQPLTIDVAVQYRVNPAEAGALYADWGGASIDELDDRIIRQATRSIIPAVLSATGWEAIVTTDRLTLTATIRQQLTTTLADHHLILEGVALREIHLPAALQAHLDRKLAAQQAVEQQQYRLTQAEIQAQQAVVTAAGQAEAQRQLAGGDADALTVRAQADARANTLLTATLTADLLRLILIDRWTGTLPRQLGGPVRLRIDPAPFLQSTDPLTPAPGR
jgi:regulator of protease activity HflC (stomatin/prohibitin superfamily)